MRNLQSVSAQDYNQTAGIIYWQLNRCTVNFYYDLK